MNPPGTHCLSPEERAFDRLAALAGRSFLFDAPSTYARNGLRIAFSRAARAGRPS